MGAYLSVICISGAAGAFVRAMDGSENKNTCILVGSIFIGLSVFFWDPYIFRSRRK